MNQKIFNKNSIRINLYTTIGCEACKIQYNILDKFCKDSEIDYNNSDVNDCDKSFLKAFEINDFPTTIIYINSNIIKISGTFSIHKLEDLIDNFI